MSSRRSSHRHSVIDPSLSKSMDSTSSETKRTKRRITQVDPNVKIADITRPTRSYPKKTVPNRSEVFNFQCEGDLPSSTEENKLHVKWQAKFDRPIEQLIYPSLQRFDNEGYEKKKKLYRQLHGSNDFVATSKTTGQPFTSNLAADGIKLDFLPAAEHMSPNIMFLHTPKWSVDITSITIVDPNANSAQTSPIKIDRPSSAKASKKNSRKDYDDDDFSDISDAFEHIIMPTFKHNNLEDEIELEGEVFLREKLRENLRLKLEEEERVKREEEEAKNPFNVTLMKSRKALTRSLPPIDDGDRLYSTLKGRRATSGNGPVAKLTDLSVEENAFLTETKVIKSMASKDNSHLLDGVLYFRVSFPALYRYCDLVFSNSLYPCVFMRVGKESNP